MVGLREAQLRHKATVNFQGVQPPVFFALGVLQSAFSRRGAELICTCLNDSHGERPLHTVKDPITGETKGYACDVRTRHVTQAMANEVFAETRLVLEPLGFDCVFHPDEWGPTGKQIMFQHIHVEYDPKGKEAWTRLE